MTVATRRNLLRAAFAGASGLLVSRPSLASALEPTPAQTEGPFHPLAVRQGPGGPVTVDRRLLRYLDRDSDLTFVADRPGNAYGTVVHLAGQVVDADGAPLEGALLEVWQACVSGRYNHRADPNDEWLDPRFQYWGRASSDAQGRFLFRTVVPGAYRASANWIRPPHVHVKASLRGYRELTSQLFFRGVPFYYGGRIWQPSILEQLNAVDGIRAALRPDQADGVTAFARAPLAGEALDPDARVCDYRLVLERSASAGGGVPAALRGL